jgi:hypothetical protein
MPKKSYKPEQIVRRCAFGRYRSVKAKDYNLHPHQKR